ncbi:MAG: PASTA domain-containing protein [Bacteroidetes bacterium]|nr:MAG: PASTA domain-containing protein [Bacteroidota bacterium]TAG86952.1 MAG: PASTA domain-containing protein [Bacteroidota bacterium]
MLRVWDNFLDFLSKYNFVKTTSILDVFVHIGLILSLCVVGIMLLFMSFLPAWTHHGDTITVPNMVGMKLNDVKRFLDSKSLDYEIDSVSTISYKDASLITFAQIPEAGLRVKQSRKIRLNVNPNVFPKVKVPFEIIGSPFIDVVNTIKNARLEIGRIQYKPYEGKNVILEITVNGKKYTSNAELQSANLMVAHKSKVDLLVADGLGDDKFDVPNLVGMTLEEAETVAKGQDLIIEKNYDYNSGATLGTIVRQTPTYYVAGNRVRDVQSREVNKVRPGQMIDVWIAGNSAGRPKKQLDSADFLEQNDNIKDAKQMKKDAKKAAEEEGFKLEKNKKNKKEPKKDETKENQK